MPTVEDVSKILTNMDSDKYDAAVRFIYYLADMPMQKVTYEGKDRRSKQIEFVNRTAGKIKIDEEAVMDLRMRSMI